jgi:hypothetical protein
MEFKNGKNTGTTSHPCLFDIKTDANTASAKNSVSNANFELNEGLELFKVTDSSILFKTVTFKTNKVSLGPLMRFIKSATESNVAFDTVTF